MTQLVWARVLGSKGGPSPALPGHRVTAMADRRRPCEPPPLRERVLQDGPHPRREHHAVPCGPGVRFADVNGSPCGATMRR
ncbi:hypothetical protein MTO96_019936 [Rhipicephalus appendiculatus]